MPVQKRGRKSAASLAVVTGGLSIPRLEPPEDLTDEQVHEWRAVVDRLPADWFPRETQALLAQYCRHVVAARRVAQLIERCEAADDFDLAEYDKLLHMQEREGRAMTSLATKMRISQQATVRAEKARKPPVQAKPWE